MKAGESYPVVRRIQDRAFSDWHTAGWEPLGAGVIVCGYYYADATGGGSHLCVRLANGSLVACSPSTDDKGQAELHAEPIHGPYGDAPYWATPQSVLDALARGEKGRRTKKYPYFVRMEAEEVKPTLGTRS